MSDRSIFELLDNGNKPDPATWKVYFHDTPISAINDYVYQALKSGSLCVANYDGGDYDPPRGSSFHKDFVSDGLPAYSFIEPRYFGNYSGSGKPANSNHPGSDSYLGIGGKPIDVRHGEGLLFDIYKTLAENPAVFNKTLLIVIYDEHGGVYDHQTPNAPPFSASAVSPFAQPLKPFNYDVFGVRVPAFFVNPSIPAGTIFQPPQPSNGAYYPFDHTTVISTLRAQFGLQGPLTPRDQVAPTLAGLIPIGASLRNDLEPPEEVKEWIAAVPEIAGHPVPPKSPEEHDRLLAERLELKTPLGFAARSLPILASLSSFSLALRTTDETLLLAALICLV